MTSRSVPCVFAILLLGSVAVSDPDPDVSLSDYGVSDEFPHGRPHPDAPEELQQFDFMVGDFDRRERSRRPDGNWGPWVEGEWNARYFMNGHAIIDESFNHQTGVTTSNLRFYDAKAGKWKITWFKEPGYSSTYAEGEMVGDELICVNKSSGDRYVFLDITDAGYEWELRSLRGGKWIAVWQISLTRKL